LGVAREAVRCPFARLAELPTTAVSQETIVDERKLPHSPHRRMSLAIRVEQSRIAAYPDAGPHLCRLPAQPAQQIVLTTTSFYLDIMVLVTFERAVRTA
jgi:hypothetical protein